MKFWPHLQSQFPLSSVPELVSHFIFLAWYRWPFSPCWNCDNTEPYWTERCLVSHRTKRRTSNWKVKCKFNHLHYALLLYCDNDQSKWILSRTSSNSFLLSKRMAKDWVINFDDAPLNRSVGVYHLWNVKSLKDIQENRCTIRYLWNWVMALLWRAACHIVMKAKQIENLSTINIYIEFREFSVTLQM